MRRSKLVGGCQTIGGNFNPTLLLTSNMNEFLVELLFVFINLAARTGSTQLGHEEGKASRGFMKFGQQLGSLQKIWSSIAECSHVLMICTCSNKELYPVRRSKLVGGSQTCGGSLIQSRC